MRIFGGGGQLPEPSCTDRAVIARQRELLAEQAETIRSLGVELEATRALVDPDRNAQAVFLRSMAVGYRERYRYWRRQAAVAFEMLRTEREQRA